MVINFRPMNLSPTDRIAALGAEIAWCVLSSPDNLDISTKQAKRCAALMTAYGASEQQKNEAIREGALWVVGRGEQANGDR